MEKLVVALQYLGYSPTQSQLTTLKNKLNIDANNKVSGKIVEMCIYAHAANY